MNILFLSTEIPLPLDHGHHIRTFNILQRIASKHKIFFIGFCKDDAGYKYREELENLCESVDVFDLSEGKYRWRLYLRLFILFFSFHPYLVKRYYKKRAVKRMQEIMCKNNIDLVYFDTLPLALYYKHVNSIKTVLVNHNIESQRLYSLVRRKRNYVTNIFWYLQYLKLRRFEELNIKLFDISVVVSENDRESLRQLCGKMNIKIIPNGVDIEYFRPSHGPTEQGSLIWTGAMNDPYNKEAVDYFLDEIFPLIKDKIPDVKIYFVGKYPTKKLLRLAEKDERLDIVGYVDDIRPYVAKSSVFIAPIQCGGGTKIKVLNALAQGKAVVTTSIGAEGIGIINGENILIADEPKEFAKNVIYLLKQPEKAKIMGEKGREYIENNHDWDNIVLKMERVYQELTNSRKGSHCS